MRFYGCTLLALSCLVAFSTSTPVPLAPNRILAANGTQTASRNFALLNSAQFQDFIGAVKSLATSLLEESDTQTGPLWSELLSNLVILRQHFKELSESKEFLQIGEDLREVGVDVDYALNFVSELFEWVISVLGEH